MTCRIDLFGGLRIVRNSGASERIQTNKPGALLAYLAYHTSREHTRDELIELLWPEVDPISGRNRLKQTLHLLRCALEAAGVATGDLLIADRSTIRLNAQRVSTDVAGFEEAYRQAALTSDPAERLGLLALASQIYRGPLLPGLYDDWIVRERERLIQVFVNGLHALAGALEQIDDVQAVAALNRAVAADPLREDSHQALIRLYADQNKPGEAIRQYRKIERLLADEVGSRPSPATEALFRAIRQGQNGEAVEVRRVRKPPNGATTQATQAQTPALARLEPIGGSVSLSSEFYVERQTDRQFAEALARSDSIVLVKGPRETGKTSLLARGLQQARESGARVVVTDIRQMTGSQLETAEQLFLTLAHSIAEQLDLEAPVTDHWDSARGWNVNFERFLRRDVLNSNDTPLVWGLDDIDRLFACSYSSEVFALFRYWHNLRSLNPTAPWSRLTLAMAYATEAHLFITDLNQSPFNVGTRLTLEDFTLEHVADLNRRYGSPLRDAAQLSRFVALLGGSPYLVRQGLHLMVANELGMPALEAAVRSENGVFRDHLERILSLVSQHEDLQVAIREVQHGGACVDTFSFYRLRSAGVLAGEAASARFRCDLYATYLERRLV